MVPSYHGYRFPPEIISHAVWSYHRFGLSLGTWLVIRTLCQLWAQVDSARGEGGQKREGTFELFCRTVALRGSPGAQFSPPSATPR